MNPTFQSLESVNFEINSVLLQFYRKYFIHNLNIYIRAFVRFINTFEPGDAMFRKIVSQLIPAWDFAKILHILGRSLAFNS